MSAVLNDLAHEVEEAASIRNFEIIATILLTPGLDRCCPWSRVYYHIAALERRLYKVNLRIQGKYRPWWQQNYEKLSLIELEQLRDVLTGRLEDDKLHLEKLEPCGDCFGCGPHKDRSQKVVKKRVEPDVNVYHDEQDDSVAEEALRLARLYGKVEVVLDPYTFNPTFIAEGEEADL